jgi:glycosyltransferase involved in cell wall biosynthesis
MQPALDGAMEATRKMNPKVTFIVPCYKLGHLLAECVNSILSQTFTDLEILIMDDCSPDSTPEVAQSFKDSRVKHIRNQPNLGHLANYNKGIGLARGEYLWLISADDFLRKPDVLEKYVRLLDGNPKIGYAFCPAMRYVNGANVGVMKSTAPLGQDKVLAGHEFLKAYELDSYCVPAPSVLVRRECYDTLSLFPLDLPYCGDWYLWCLFAMFYDVGYFAEPMVSRRFHDANISHFFRAEGVPVYFYNLLEVPTRIKDRAEKEGFQAIAENCKLALANAYLRQLTPPKPNDYIQANISVQEFEESLPKRVADPKSQSQIRASVYSRLADHFYEQREFVQARGLYQRALDEDNSISPVRAKALLLRMGALGVFLRNILSAVKR